MARLVCETDASIAIYAPVATETSAAGPGPLIIAFPLLTSRINGLEFWGHKMLAAGGVSALGIMSKQPQWLVRDEMARMLPALLPIIARHKPNRIITLGQSMGATAALVHGRTLGADLAAAFSPHYSIDPAVIRDFDRREKRTFDPKLHTGFKVEASDLPPLPVLFYDPLFAWDREHAHRIEALSPRIQRVLVTGTGHFSVTPFLSNRKGWRSLVDLLLNEPAATIARTARNMVRTLRGDTPDYHQELSAQLLRHGRPVLALRSATRAFELQPNNLRRRIHLNTVRERLAAR